MDENPHNAAKRILEEAFTPQPEKAEEPTQDTEKLSSTSETLEPEAAEKPVEDLENLEPEKDEDSINTLNRLAETLDISIEDMYALDLKITNDDPRSLGELKSFFEANKDIDQARQEIENERSQLQADKDKLKDVPPVSQEHIEALANVRLLENEWQSLEASGLKQSNPGEYAARGLEIQNKYTVASNNLNNIQTVIDSKRTEKLRVHQQELHKLAPELKEDETRVKAVDRVTKMFKGFNVDPEYIGMIEDPRAVHMLLELSKLFEQKGNYKSKRVDTAPKVLKPQAVRNSEAGKQASLKRLTEKARQSNNTGDKVAVVSALIRG